MMKSLSTHYIAATSFGANHLRILYSDVTQTHFIKDLTDRKRIKETSTLKDATPDKLYKETSKKRINTYYRRFSPVTGDYESLGII